MSVLYCNIFIFNLIIEIQLLSPGFVGALMIPCKLHNPLGTSLYYYVLLREHIFPSKSSPQVEMCSFRWVNLLVSLSEVILPSICLYLSSDLHLSEGYSRNVFASIGLRSKLLVPGGVG